MDVKKPWVYALKKLNYKGSVDKQDGLFYAYKLLDPYKFLSELDYSKY